MTFAMAIRGDAPFPWINPMTATGPPGMRAMRAERTSAFGRCQHAVDYRQASSVHMARENPATFCPP